MNYSNLVVKITNGKVYGLKPSARPLIKIYHESKYDIKASTTFSDLKPSPSSKPQPCRANGLLDVCKAVMVVVRYFHFIWSSSLRKTS